MSYEKDLARALLKLGRLGTDKNYYGGFSSSERDIYQHALIEQSYDRLGGKDPLCGKWVKLIDVEEHSEHEFTDTFSDPAEVHYVEGKLSCECGLIDGEKLFYSGTLHELLGEVLKSTNLLED